MRWCQVCDWNVDPLGDAATRGRRHQFIDRFAERNAHGVYEAVSRHGPGQRRIDLFTAGAFVLAAAVHSMTVAVAACALVIVVRTGAAPLGLLLAAGLACLALVVRPRLGRAPSEKDRLRPNLRIPQDAAPSFHALVKRVATAAGAKAPHTIFFNARFNASFSTIGVRRRRVLTIGAPLWAILDPDQRVALLAHELAHQANGDTRRGLVLGSALRSLGEWSGMFRTHRDIRGAVQDGSNAMNLVVSAVLSPLRLTSVTTLRILQILTLRASQRAEYRADGTSAAIAGTKSIANLLDALTSARAVGYALGRLGRRDPAVFWQSLRDEVNLLPDTERERLRRIALRQCPTLDDSHPPYELRRTFVTSVERHATMTLTSGEVEQIDMELGAVLAVLAQRLAR